jgi:hydroxyethylthiazole kinase-like uncharacterized protein yjeF
MSLSPPSNSSPSSPHGEPILIDARLLREWPLPQPEEHHDKDARGRVLVVGGAAEMPGAIILAAEAALRAGAGKLRIAVPASIAPWVGTAVPEARVLSLAEAESGAVARSAIDTLLELAHGVDCVLFGPGMVDQAATGHLMATLLPELHGPTVVLDAAALPCVSHEVCSFSNLEGNAILTPHAGEMATCLQMEKSVIVADPTAAARLAAERFGGVVALKGSETLIAAPSGECYINRTGNVGLATSGSGDTLAGIVAGLAARGATPIQAAVWGVHLHGCAGDRLAQTVGPLGFLARELLAEVPRLMAEIGSSGS